MYSGVRQARRNGVLVSQPSNYSKGVTMAWNEEDWNRWVKNNSEHDLDTLVNRSTEASRETPEQARNRHIRMDVQAAVKESLDTIEQETLLRDFQIFMDNVEPFDFTGQD